MNRQKLIAALTTLLCMVGVKASAIAITNEDGVAIYYSYINNNTELSVSTSEIGYSGDIVIPESVTIDGNTFKVTNIGSYAFNSCSKLTSVRIPNSVTNISNNAFYQCTGLTSVNIPSNIMSIGNNAFYNCYKLEKVIINNLAAWCAISFENDTNCPLRYAKKLYIDEDTEIKDLVIPEGVTTIGKYSFFGCSGLTSLSIPNSITSIGEYAFQNCSGLTSVTFPNSVMSIGYGAFNYCTGLEKVIVNDLAAWCGLSFFSQTQNPLYYAKHLYSDENTEITNLVIPESVTNIGNYTFSYCSGLTSVTIPNSVKSIGEGAFYCCESLTSATIPNSVKSIGNFAFNQCSSLNSVVIPEGVTIIGRCAFLQCKGLSSMIIPNSVTTIDESAFSGCTGLTSVTIGNGVMHIGGSAFSYCTGLTSVTIPSSVKSIGGGAFFGCGLNKIIVNDLTAWCGISFEMPDENPLYYVRHLYSDEDTEIKDLIIPAGVTTISDYAFVYCSSFTSVTVPNSVASIGNWAFQNCTGLTSVISLIKEPTSYGTNAFQNVSATLYVPNGQTAAYQNAGWNTFKNIVESGESAPVSIADASGLATYCPEVGVDFSNSADIAAYKASVDNNTVTLTRVYKVAAGEGVLIRSLNDNAVNDANVLIDIETTKSADNAFVGTLTAKTLSEKDGSITNFVLSKNKDGVVGFYKANNTPIAAGKAYLPVANYDAEAGARGLTLVFDDGNTTSISEIDNATTADNAVYTLSGARVKNAAKGIYVKNGKKVVIK